MVRVGMARRTTHVGKMEWQNLIGPPGHAHFVAVRTSNRCVRPDERITRLAVHRQGERRLMEILNGMTTFTFILVRRSGKLAVVSVLMAIHAGREFCFINRVLPCRQVALVTFHLDVLASEGIAGCVMLLNTKERWLPTFHRVAFGALTLLCP